jgi:hypothetical protein
MARSARLSGAELIVRASGRKDWLRLATTVWDLARALSVGPGDFADGGPGLAAPVQSIVQSLSGS